MTREFSVIVGIDAGKARRGAREFKAASNEVVRGSKRMATGIRGANRRAVALITTIGRLRGVATLAFAGFLGVGGITSVIRTLTQFQTEISRVTALLGDRGTTGVVNALTDRARELGATTQFTATQAAEGIRFLTLAGFEASEAYAAVGDALNLAAAGSLALGESADILSNILSAFNVEASRATEIADALAFTSARSNTSIRQLGEAIKFVGPIAGALGVSAEETSVALGILGNAGLQASLAGTSLRRTLSGILNPTKEAEKVFEDLGVTQDQLLSQLDGPGGLVRLIELLADQGISAAQAFTLFGQRGAPGLLALVSQKDDLRELTKALADASGEAERQARILRDNLGGDALTALSAVQDAILALGDAGLTDFLRESVQGFTGFIRGLTQVKTPADDLTESISAGVRAGTLLRENFDKIKIAAVALALVLSRNLLIAFSSAAISAATFFATLVSGATAMQVLNRVVLLAVVGFQRLAAAITATGVGAIAVGIGLLAAYALSTREAADENENLEISLEDLATEAEKASIQFTKLGEAQRRVAIGAQEDRVRQAADALKAATAAIKDREAALGNLAFAEELAAESAQKVADANESARKSMSQFAGVGVIASGVVQENIRVQDGLSRTQQLANQDLTELQAALEAANEEYKNQAETLKLMKLVQDGFAESVEEARKKLEEQNSEVKKAAELYEEFTGLTQEAAAEATRLVEGYDKQATAIRKLIEDQEVLSDLQGKTPAQLAAIGTSTAAVARAQETLNFELRKARSALTPYQQELERWQDRLEDAAASSDKVAQAQIEYKREVRAAARAVQQGTLSIQDYVKWVQIQKGILDETTDELAKACEETDKLADCQSEAAKRIEQLWDQAMRNVQDAFADAFKGAFDSFDDFADRLIDAFKDMISNMLAAWFTSGLQNLFSGQGFGAGGNSFPFANLFGGGGGAGAGGAGGGAGGFAGLLGGLKNVGSALLGAAKAFTVGAQTFFTTGATTGVFAGGAAAGTGALAAAGVTGLASGFAVDQILGGRGDQGTTNLLSGAGGVIGGILGGPLGALIGGAIGSFASNLFGGAKALESAVVDFSATQDGFLASLTKVTSKQRSFFRGRKFSTAVENLDVSAFTESFANVIGAIRNTGEQLGVDVDAALESFSFEREINVKGRSEEQIEAALQDAFNDAVVEAINTLVNNVEGVSDRLRATVNLFSDNAEEFVAAFEAAAAIDLALAINPVETVLESIAAANKTVTQSYQELLGAYRDLVSEYDGSLESLQFLAQATGILKQAQIELAAALISAGQEISATFQDSAQTIRESLLSEEELYNLRRSQIDDLVTQANSTTDPAELRALADEINQLTNDAFGLLTEDQQSALGQEFIDFFGELDELFGGQIQSGLDTLEEDSSAIDQEVADGLTAAAQSIIDANNDARDFWRDWRDWIREDRGRGGLGGNTRIGRELAP